MNKEQVPDSKLLTFINTKSYIIYIAITLIALLVFFRFPVLLTWDSAHYLSYIPILDGTVPIGAWDVVRGPVFPVYLWLITSVFGTSTNAMLAVFFIVFAGVLFLYFLMIRHIVPIRTELHKLLAVLFVCVMVGLNPLVFGYHHVMLTEHLASLFAVLVALAAIKYYEYLISGAFGWKYRICQCILVLSCPVLYFLKQNYVMMAICAVLAVFVLTLLQKRGINNILRSLGLIVCTAAVFAASVIAWNSILPEPGSDYMKGRTSERIFTIMFIANTQYIKYTDEPDGIMASFYNNDGELIEEFITEENASLYDLTVKQTLGMALRSFTRHPGLVAKGILDSYLTIINFYCMEASSYDSFHVVKKVSLLRSVENGLIAYQLFSPEMNTNIYHMSPELYEHAKHFEDGRSRVKDVISYGFWWARDLSNLTFTIGFLLLPFCWIASIVFVYRHRDKRAFVLAFAASTISFGYLMLNTISQHFADRYAFPVYILSWAAIASLVYGIYKTAKKKNAEAICMQIPDSHGKHPDSQ